MRALLLPALLLVTPVAPAADGAVPTQPPASIRQAAHDFLLAQARQWSGEARIEVGEPDARLRLTRCDRPLIAEFAPGARPVGNTTVGVRCTGSTSWSLYLPARAQVFADVLVAAHPLARGVPLTEADLTTQRLDLAAAAGSPLTVPAQAVGKRLRYPLAAGTALSAAMLEAPTLIKRGQAVTILSGNAGIEVRAAGEALADGAGGDTVRVRNLLTRRILEGTIQAAGVVRVPM